MVKVLLISGQELENLLTPEALVEAIADAFKKFSEGITVTPSRTVMWVEGNWWGIMQSYVPGYGVGVKVVNVVPANVERGLPTIQALVTLYDPITGSPLAVVEGSILTALRTAAASALSVKYLAPSEAGPVAMIGAGFQARYQLRFALHYFKATEVRIFDVRREASEAFAKYVEELGLKPVITSRPEEAIRGARLIIEASTTREPVIIGEALEPPVHIVSIGAHTPDSRAIDDDAILKAKAVVVDSRKAVMEETGDIIQPVRDGLLNLSEICELGELVASKCPKPVRRGGITIYKSVGVAIQDACAAGLAYKLAKERGVGREVEL